MTTTAPCLHTRTHTTGEKVIEHLRKWLEPDQHLAMLSERAWAPGQEREVATAMLDLFHLLPAQAVKFLETHGAARFL